MEITHIKIVGSSLKKEFVICSVCKKKFSWLKGYKDLEEGHYIAICFKCKRMLHNKYLKSSRARK